MCLNTWLSHKLCISDRFWSDTSSWNSCMCSTRLENLIWMSTKNVSQSQWLNFWTRFVPVFTSEQFTNTCDESSGCAVKDISSYSDNQCRAIDIIQSKVCASKLDRESWQFKRFESSSRWGSKFAGFMNKKSCAAPHNRTGG